MLLTSGRLFYLLFFCFPWYSGCPSLPVNHSIFTLGKYLGHSPGVFSSLKWLLILDFNAPVFLGTSQGNQLPFGQESRKDNYYVLTKQSRNGVQRTRGISIGTLCGSTFGSSLIFTENQHLENRKEMVGRGCRQQFSQHWGKQGQGCSFKH